MDLSILITTFKRAELLRWGLLSLSKQKINCEYEIIVLNDGIEDDTKTVCDEFPQLPIRYIFTGQRNIPKIRWRVAGFAVNIGIQQAKGKNIIITCAEIFILDSNAIQDMVDVLNNNPKAIAITDGKDDTTGAFLEHVKISNGNINPDLYYTVPLHELCVRYPFLLGVNRQIVLDIGGYDEDFIGFAYEDTDFARRLVQNGGEYITVNARIVHLFHGRHSGRTGLYNIDKLFAYNKRLYDERNNITKRNIGRDWGVLDV